MAWVRTSAPWLDRNIRVASSARAQAARYFVTIFRVILQIKTSNMTSQSYQIV